MILSGRTELARFIKNIHQELREKSKSLGADTAWTEHCQDSKKLEKYALAMKELATLHWEKSSHVSRIWWIYNTCKNYFSNDISSIRIKEDNIKKKMIVLSAGDEVGTIDIQYNRNLVTNNCEQVYKLLDVGSCYNPFQHFDQFEVTAIDIAPALKTVLKCDFLKVRVGENFLTNCVETTELPKEYFDVVVFSLFLEYLPCPSQRKLSCEKAYKLLKQEGILVIITPDSNHIGANAKYIKSWQFVLAEIGFSRIKYEKLKHIHCMIFRKVPVKEILLRWINIYKKKQVFDEIYIPQDFKKNTEKIIAGKCIEKLVAEDVRIMNEVLPFSDEFVD